MCGIAGIISRNGEREIGSEMTRMLQSMKHRGPDSTGYALYGPPSDDWVMRVKLADANTPRDFEFADRLARHQRDVLARVGGFEIPAGRRIETALYTMVLKNTSCYTRAAIPRPGFAGGVLRGATGCTSLNMGRGCSRVGCIRRVRPLFCTARMAR
jgi:hypothetical protein